MWDPLGTMQRLTSRHGFFFLFSWTNTTCVVLVPQVLYQILGTINITQLILITFVHDPWLLGNIMTHSVYTHFKILITLGQAGQILP